MELHFAHDIQIKSGFLQACKWCQTKQLYVKFMDTSIVELGSFRQGQCFNPT